MESSENKTFEFNIIADYNCPIEEAIASCNYSYKTDFNLVEYIEVNSVRFAKIRATEANLKYVFNLGYIYSENLDKDKS